MIINEGSFTNVTSTILVDKLSLLSLKYLRPYNLQWLNKHGEIKVIKQVKVLFTIGKYKNQITCDVVLIHAKHLLLGRPSLYDSLVVHDGFIDWYKFITNGKPITLSPNKCMLVK